MLPLSVTTPLVVISIFASSFLLVSDSGPRFQASFEKASTVDVPTVEISDFSEFPEVHSTILAELKTRNDEMRKCSERKRCVFLVAYVDTLQNRLETISDNKDPLGYLERKYGNKASDFVKENKDLIELKFDEHFTAGFLRKTKGKILSVDNGFSREEVRRIYEDYAINEAIPELIENIRKTKSPKMKAIHEFGLRYLLSDVRLLTQSK